MSRNTPYHNVNYVKQLSPNHISIGKLSQKSRMGKSVLANDSTIDKKYYNHNINDRNLHIKVTEKKKIDTNNFRIETLIQQNKFLLQENNQLSNLLDQKCKMVRILENKIQQQIAQQVSTLEQIQLQKNKFIQDFCNKTDIYQNNVENLLGRIRLANQDKIKYQGWVKEEINFIKEECSKDAKTQIETIALNHGRSMELVQIQLEKLKAKLQSKECELEKTQQQYRISAEKMKGEIERLNGQLTHVKHINKMELSQQRIHFQNTIQQIQKQGRKEQQIQHHHYNVEINKIKNDLIMKQKQIDQLNNDKKVNGVENNFKIQELQNKKIQLEIEIGKLQHYYKQLLHKQVNRIQQINQIEINNIENTSQSTLNNLKSENIKLLALNKAKTQEIQAMYKQITEMRNQYKVQTDTFEKIIQELKNKLSLQSEENVIQDEVFKVKLAHLRQTDIKTMKDYYQHQSNKLIQDNTIKDQIIKANRQQIHEELQQKANMRKQFDIEIEEMKIKISQLQLQLSQNLAAQKEEINNIGSKMELTSMTLIRQSKEKQRYSIFNQEQKRKLQKIVDTKNTEISQLIKRNNSLKIQHAKEIQHKYEELGIVKKSNEDLQAEIKKERKFYDSDLAKKQATIKQIRQFYEQQLTKLKIQSTTEYQKAVKQLSQIKGKLEIEITRLNKSQADLKNQLAMLKSFKQQENVEKDIVLNDEKERLKNQKNKSQTKIKQFYQKKLHENKLQIELLQQQLSQKQNDIRDIQNKYHNLEIKLQELMQSQEKLKSLETKVINLGQQNNAVKNLAEIIKLRKK